MSVALSGAVGQMSRTGDYTNYSERLGPGWNVTRGSMSVMAIFRQLTGSCLVSNAYGSTP